MDRLTGDCDLSSGIALELAGIVDIVECGIIAEKASQPERVPYSGMEGYEPLHKVPSMQRLTSLWRAISCAENELSGTGQLPDQDKSRTVILSQDYQITGRGVSALICIAWLLAGVVADHV